MIYLFEIAVFAAKLVIVIGMIAVAMLIVIAASQREKPKGSLEIEDLRERWLSMRDILQSQLLDKKAFKAYLKKDKSEREAREKNAPTKKTFVLKFQGDIAATAVQNLREEVSAILTIATTQDQVVIRLESPGGMVSEYGLGASQISRLRQADIPVIVCVDKVAASGGYLMAVVGSKILAAPFAVLGSIGVVASLPNFNRLLKKNDVDYLELTAGQYKRTVSVLGEITESGLNKFHQELNDTHTLFKSFVAQYRPQIEIDKIATGEHWYGTRALELGLIDEIKTSDQFIIEQFADSEVLEVKYQSRPKLLDRLTKNTEASLIRVFQELWLRISNTRSM